MKQVNLRLSEALLKAVDSDRGDVPRNRYIVRLLEGALGVPEKPVEVDRVLKEPADPRIARQIMGPAPRAALKGTEAVLCKKCESGMVRRGVCTNCKARQ